MTRLRTALAAWWERHICGPDLWGGDLSTLDRMDGLR